MKCKKCGSDVLVIVNLVVLVWVLQKPECKWLWNHSRKDTLNKQNENDYNQSPKEVNNINEQPKNKNIFKI